MILLYAGFTRGGFGYEHVVFVKTKRLARNRRGAWNQADGPQTETLKQNPENMSVFGASKQTSPTNRPVESFFHPDYHCRPRNYTGSCPLVAEGCPLSQRGKTSLPEEARGLYHRSGISPCPEGNYSVEKIITSVWNDVNSYIDV